MFDYENAKGEHKHVCKACGTEWVHVQIRLFSWLEANEGKTPDDFDAEYDKRHLCPKCGRDERMKTMFTRAELTACEVEMRAQASPAVVDEKRASLLAEAQDLKRDIEGALARGERVPGSFYMLNQLNESIADLTGQPHTVKPIRPEGGMSLILFGYGPPPPVIQLIALLDATGEHDLASALLDRVLNPGPTLLERLQAQLAELEGEERYVASLPPEQRGEAEKVQ